MKSTKDGDVLGSVEGVLGLTVPCSVLHLLNIQNRMQIERFTHHVLLSVTFESTSVPTVTQPSTRSLPRREEEYDTCAEPEPHKPKSREARSFNVRICCLALHWDAFGSNNISFKRQSGGQKVLVVERP